MFNRYLNASYSVFSYTARRITGISISPPVPPAISVELSSRCNLSCPECMTGSGQIHRSNDYINYNLVSKIAHELKGTVLSAWLYFQGEPMMHPQFFDIIELFSEMNPVISTNGHFLDMESCINLAASPLRKIIISYDGISPQAYNIYRRGGDHSKVTRGIELLAAVIREKRSDVKLEIQFLLHKRNEHEVKAVAAFAASVGAQFRIKSMQVLDHTRVEEWIPSDTRRSRYINKNGKWETSGTRSGGCMRMWMTSVITSDGDVVPCCYDKNGYHKMGNIKDQTFKEIWLGEKYRSFHNTVMKNRKMVDICHDCPQGKRLIFKS